MSGLDLEPASYEAKHQGGLSDTQQAHVSTAISLKRIADALTDPKMPETLRDTIRVAIVHANRQSPRS